MTAGGWVKAHRAMRSHPMLHNAMRKGVWLDLLLMAAHEPTRVTLRGRTVDLQPGQCAVVIAEWAKSLALTPRQIERIVDSFVSENAVSKASAAGKAFTVITLCNYGKYQSHALPRGGSAVEGTGEARWKGGGREQEPEESIESSSSPDDGRPPKPGDAALAKAFEAEFWPAYPKRKGKAAAKTKFIAKAKHVGVEVIMQGLERANREWVRKGTEPDFIPHPTTWLNQGRWEDEPDQKPAAQARKSNTVNTPAGEHPYADLLR